MRRTKNIAVYLCLLLLVNEFGPAHFKRLHVQNLRKQVTKEENGNSVVSKRSIMGTFGKWAAKVLVYGGKTLEITTSIAAVATTFLNLVTEQKCCYGKWTNTCEWTNEAKDIEKQLGKKKDEINAIVLETKQLESMITMASDEFNYTVMEMHTIGKASDKLLKSIDRNISIQLNLTDARLENLVREKEAIGQTVDFVELETQYFNVLDGVLGIAVPMVTTILPAVPKLKLWMKARMGRYKSYELDHSVDAKVVKAPPKGSPRYQAGNSWFSKKAATIADKIGDAQDALKTKYKGVAKLIKNFRKGFETVMSFSKAALNIYTMYSQFRKCDEAYSASKSAVEEMRTARTEMNKVYDQVIESRQTMREARDKLKEQLVSEIFINDLKELRDALKKLIPEGTDDGFEAIIASITEYVDGIEQKDPEFIESFNLIKNLYQGLGQLSYYFNCYTAKTTLISAVAEKCKIGEGTISELKKQMQTLLDSDSDTCQTKIGIAPFSDSQLQSVVDKKAEKDNFNRKCMANNDVKRRKTCSLFCQGTEPDSLPARVGVDKEIVDIFLESCKPPCPIPDGMKKGICNLLENGKAASEILTYLPKDRHTAQQIEELDC